MMILIVNVYIANGYPLKTQYHRARNLVVFKFGGISKVDLRELIWWSTKPPNSKCSVVYT